MKLVTFGSGCDVLADDTAQVLRPLDVAAAVLLGRALNDNRPGLARLQDSDSATIVEVPTTDLVAPVAQLLRHEIIGIGAIMDVADLRVATTTVVAPGTVAFFRDPDNGKTTKLGDGNAEIAAAVQRRCAIVGISVDADRLLPRDLVRLADVRIGVPRLDSSAIAEVIAAVTGRHPGRVDDAFASRVTLDALNLAVRADLGAERSLARLERILGGANLLKEYGVRSVTVRIGTITVKGYRRTDLAEVWRRYLPAQAETSGTSDTNDTPYDAPVHVSDVTHVSEFGDDDGEDDNPIGEAAE